MKLQSFILLLLMMTISGSPAPAKADDQAFFKPYSVFHTEISPNGKHAVELVDEDESQIIRLIHLDTLKRFDILNNRAFSNKKIAIARIRWIDNDSLIISTIVERRGVKQLREGKYVMSFFIADINTRDDKRDTTLRRVLTSGTVPSLPQQENTILYAKAGLKSSVYKIDTGNLPLADQVRTKTSQIDGGQFVKKNIVAEVEGYATRWLSNAGGDITAVMTFKQNGASLLTRADGRAAWSPLKEWTFEKDEESNSSASARKNANKHDPEKVLYYPLAFGRSAQEFVVLSDKDDEEGILFRYDFSTKAKERVFSMPGAEILDVEISFSNYNLLSVSYMHQGNVAYHYFDSQFETAQKQLQRHFPQYSVYITSSTPDGKMHTAVVMSPTEPGKTVAYDSRTQKIIELSTAAPWINRKQLTDTSFGSIERGGLTIEYLLSAPKKGPKPPLLVMPHGGPFGVSDIRLYNPLIQYLSSRGYAVLQVNYRGSAGYGKKFSEAGKGQFGGEMLADIEAVVKHVTSQGAVDANRRCAIGASYGGYAALMLAIRNPDAYQCVASFAGVTDIGLLFTASGDPGEGAIDFFTEHVGDPTKDYDYFKTISPVYNLEKLNAPLHFAHGGLDRNVDIEHALRLKHRLDQLGKIYQWKYYENEAHGFSSPELESEYYASLLAFINGHLHDAK